MNSELLESFFSVYATIQSSYKAFILDSFSAIKLKDLKLYQENVESNEYITDLLAFFAADILVANRIYGENHFSIMDLVFGNDEFINQFGLLTKKLYPTLDPFLDTEILTLDVFHFLGERLVRKEILDSGAVFTPSGVVRLLAIQALHFFLKKNTSLNDAIIFEILLNPTPQTAKKLNKTELDSIHSLISNIRVLDPACGTGLFFFEIVEVLFQIQQIFSPSFKRLTRAEIFRDNVYGIDINPKIMFKLRIIIQLWLIKNGENVSNPSFLYDNFICADSLLKDYSKEPKFDMVIGNPPYIRQENIRSQRASEHIYKEEIAKKFPINKRSDLYIYFFYLGLSRLKENGVLSFLTSSSWLNIGFGFEFQDYIIQNTELCSIIDFDYKAFSSAEINTVITTLSQPSNKKYDAISHFINLKSAVTKENVTRTLQKIYQDKAIIEDNTQILENETLDFRIRRINQKEIQGGTRWGNELLLAPPIYFKLKKKIGEKLIRLGDIAYITRGITTGLNKFFILEKISENNDVITVRNGYDYECEIEREFLQPFLIGPKRMLNPIIEKNELRHYLLRLPEIFDEEGNSHARKYVEYGKNKEIEQTKGKNKGKSLIGAQNVPTLTAKNKFYAIKLPQTSIGTHIFIQKIFSSKYKIYFTSSENKIWANNTFYNINLKPDYEKYSFLIIASLLSSITYLSVELNGRRSFGMGALDTATFDVENIMIVEPRQIHDPLVKKRIEKCADSIASRQFLEVIDEFKMEDRTELDKIFLDHLNLGENQQELYENVEKLVHQRISKSKTYKKE